MSPSKLPASASSRSTSAKKGRWPTEAELAILSVLWSNGPSTVREVHESLGDRKTRYTTTLKQLQVMTEKRLVRRDDSLRRHVYSANMKEVAAKRSLLREFLDRVFEGSLGNLVLHALDAKSITPRELEEIRKLLEDHKQHQRKNEETEN